MKTNKETDSLVESYLTFKLDEEEFAVNVKNVLNILERKKITKVPRSPDYMMGVINLRGKVLPVIDTRLKLGMSPAEFTDNTCIIVMEMTMNDEIVYVGGLVDKVEEVHQVDPETIQPAPDITKGIDTDFLKGITQVNEQFIQVLEVEKIFSDQELKSISEIKKSQ